VGYAEDLEIPGGRLTTFTDPLSSVVDLKDQSNRRHANPSWLRPEHPFDRLRVRAYSYPSRLTLRCGARLS
jgi:hypothetical protein